MNRKANAKKISPLENLCSSALVFFLGKGIVCTKSGKYFFSVMADAHFRLDSSSQRDGWILEKELELS